MSSFVLASPGPVAALAVASALTHGRAAWVVVPGAGLDDLIALSIALGGVGALLAGAPNAAAAMKAAGAAVLIWLGFRTILTAGEHTVFYVSYVPQFVDSSRSIWPQLVLMQATFLALAADHDGVLRARRRQGRNGARWFAPARLDRRGASSPPRGLGLRDAPGLGPRGQVRRVPCENR